MKNLTHTLTGLSLLLALFACSKAPIDTILPSDFSGKWAEVDEYGHSDSYLDFYLGKCYSYTCNGKHRVTNDQMYGCRNMIRNLEKESDFCIIGDKMVIGDAPEAVFFRITDDHIRIGGKDYRRFKSFVDEQYPDDIPQSVIFSQDNYALLDGRDSILTFRTEPAYALWTKTEWFSDRDDIVSVDETGKITAINVGTATISVRLDDIVTGTCKVSVGSDLSAKESANCYIVSSFGGWEFRCDVKGNSQEQLPKADSVAVLWESKGTMEETVRGDIIHHVKLDSTKVLFTAGRTDGNALIGVFKNKEVLWSWHIWVCRDYDPRKREQAYRNFSGFCVGTMMDRNLGALNLVATSAANYGLFYQWGRKDPFPGSGAQDRNGPCKYTLGEVPKTQRNATTGTVAYATAHPTELLVVPDGDTQVNDWIEDANDNLWASAKTMYDPCPPGWRVPDGMAFDENNKVVEKGVWFGTHDSVSSEYYRWILSSTGSHLIPGTVSINLAETFRSSRSTCIYPTAGRIDPNGNYVHSNARGYYWSCKAEKTITRRSNALTINYQDHAYGLYFSTLVPGWFGCGYRSQGYNVRCQKME